MYQPLQESIQIHGQEVPLAAFKRALQEVFDAIPKGKRFPLMRQMSLVEFCGLEAFREKKEGDHA